MRLVGFFFGLLAIVIIASAMPATDNSQVLGVTRIGTHEEMLKVKERMIEERRQELATLGMNSTLNDTSSPFSNSTTSSTVAERWVVGCDKPASYLDPEYIDVLTRYWSDWCDAGNHIWPSMGYYADFGPVRVAVCNFGWWNPCTSGEMKEAWDRIDDMCPKTDDGKSPVAGNWYEKDWAKSYERSNCHYGRVCDKYGYDCAPIQRISGVPDGANSSKLERAEDELYQINGSA